MHSAQRVSTLVCILAGALLAAPAQARIVAVAVGIDDYDSPQITPLRAAVSDATAFANALCDHCGAAAADVKVLSTATSEYHSRPTKANIIMYLKWAERAIAPDDTLVFFFAGHGINRWGKSYILPVDANTTDADLVALTSLAVEDLNNVLAGIQCAHQVIIMDCCRNDPDQGRGDGANAATESLVRDVRVLGQTGHSRAGAQTSTVLFSCMSGQRAYECPDGRHGVFTHFLLQGLAGAAGRGGQVTLGDICDYVEQEVPTYVKLAVGLREDAAQNPWHKSEGSGQVLLVRGAPVASPVAMPDTNTTVSHPDNRDVTILGPEGPTVHGRKWALVIGCNGYNPQQVGQLKVAVQDAKRMRNCLVSVAGFPRENVILITDEGLESVAVKDSSVRPTYITLLGRIADFCAQHNESDVLVIYFAGHGFHSKSARKDYLAPLDVQRSALTLTAIAVDDVLDHLKGSGARQGVLIADACRNVVGRVAPGDEVGVGDQSLRAATARGVWYLSSCSPGQISIDDEKLEDGGGIYTYWLTQGLGGQADGVGGLGSKDGFITVREAHAYAEQQVAAQARARGQLQHPTRSDIDVTDGEMVLATR